MTLPPPARPRPDYLQNDINQLKAAHATLKGLMDQYGPSTPSLIQDQAYLGQIKAATAAVCEAIDTYVGLDNSKPGGAMD